MDRRPIGIGLVIVALAAVMVLPVLSGLPSSGTAVPIALPAPPAVGDCAVHLTGAAWYPRSTPRRVSVSDLQFGSCRGRVAGEVVAFWATEGEMAGAPRSRRAGPCYPSMVVYAGLAVTGAAAESVSWRPAISYQAYLVIPSELERRAGRDWFACVIAPGSEHAYYGRLRDSFPAGTLPVGFGSCWVAGDAGQLLGPTDCTQPHTAQLLATGWSGNSGPGYGGWGYGGSGGSGGSDASGEGSGGPGDAVTASCRQVAGALMEVDDATRGGELLVVADRMDLLTQTWPGNPATIGCFVAATEQRQLAGLVLALGDRPVPFVP